MTTFGQPRRHLAECASTNDVAREWALNPEDPAPSGALVSADFQTSGRGQRGHQWQAGTGESALMSFVYRLPPQSDPALLGLMTALAVAESLAALDFSPQIKWPNDLLLSGGKVGGVLVEVAAGVAVLGIGINVNQTAFEGASEFAFPPTSLRLVSGRVPSVDVVVDAVGISLTLLEDSLHSDRALILDGCRARLALGAPVRQGQVTGTLIGLTVGGAAIVRLPNGTFAEWTALN